MRPKRKYSVRIEVALIAIIVMIGNLLVFNVPQAQANFLTGGTSYRVLFTMQNGVYAIPVIQDGKEYVKYCVLIASGDKIPGPTRILVNGGYRETLNPKPQNWEKKRAKGARLNVDKDTYEGLIPMSILRTDGLPNTIEAYTQGYKPWSKDNTVAGKLEEKLGAEATATFVLQKVAVNSQAQEEKIAVDNAKAQLGRSDSSDADTLAGFFESSASASASANATDSRDGSTASASATASASGGFDGQAGNAEPTIQTQPARQSGDLVLQFRVGQFQTIRIIDPQGRQIGPDHTGRANDDNGGSIIVANNQLPLGGSVVVIAQTSSDRGMMQRTIPIPGNFAGRTVDFR